MEILSNILFYFFSFVIVVSIIVFVHEFGHYCAAILNKVKVETFSIGFGKEIFGWNDKRGTRWKFCYFPFGGYIKMFGEDNFSSKKKIPLNLSKYAFSKKKIYQKFLIVLAGPLANFIFGIIGFAFIYSLIGKTFIPAVINKVENNSPAFMVGLLKDDKIIKIDNNKIESFNDIGIFINLYKKKTYSFELIRNEKILKKKNLIIFQSTSSYPCEANELNLNVKIKKYVGVYENLNSFRHDVSHGFIVSPISGKIKTDFQSEELKFFKKIPKNTVPHHKKMIKDVFNKFKKT